MASHDNNFDLIRLVAATQVLVMHAIAWLKSRPLLCSWKRPPTVSQACQIFFAMGLGGGAGFAVALVLVPAIAAEVWLLVARPMLRRKHYSALPLAAAT